MPYLLGASTPVTTVTTPSSPSARRESMCLMRACGYGECNILPISMPGTLRSSVYLPWPVVLPAESISAMGLPMMEKSDIRFWLLALSSFSLGRHPERALLLRESRDLHLTSHNRPSHNRTYLAATIPFFSAST